jgi:hypothetical protein
MAAARVAVELGVWSGQMHMFQIAAPMVPEADRSLRQIGNYIREATDRKTKPPVVQGHHRVAVCTARAPGSRRGVTADSALKPAAAVHNSPSNWR